MFFPVSQWLDEALGSMIPRATACTCCPLKATRHLGHLESGWLVVTGT